MMSVPNGSETPELQPVHEMTDREILEEILTHMRSTAQLVSGAISSLNNNPMMKQMTRLMGGGR